MTTFLDTSVIVRYLVGVPDEHAASARTLLDSDRPLVIPTVALAETAFVLTRNYGVSRADVVDALVRLLGRVNVSVHELPTAIAIQALMLCRPSGRIAFSDALIWAAARTTPERRVVTFDQRFPDTDIERELLAL